MFDYTKAKEMPSFGQPHAFRGLNRGEISIETGNEIADWCEQMFGPSSGSKGARWDHVLTNNTAAFYFREEEDAFKFKMWWG